MISVDSIGRKEVRMNARQNAEPLGIPGDLAVRTSAELSRAAIADLVEAFMASQDIAETSKAIYERALRPFTEWVVENGVLEPNRNDILAYKDHLKGKGLEALTISSYLVAVRKFFEWMESIGLYPNVARGIKGAKRTRGFRKQPLTTGQVRELLSHLAQDETIEGKRDYAIVNLLVRTGLRTIEITRADVGDIRQEGGEAVLWIQGKGRDAKDDFVLLTDCTLKPIMAYLQARGAVKDSDPLFVSCSDRNGGQRLTTRTIRAIVKDSLRAIGLDSPKLTAHSLRHTAITLSLQAGASTQEARALARHADINTTLVYAHNIDRIAHAPERKIDALLESEGDGGIATNRP
jgi:integrase/recombinase XerC/integrase/recombinase XerD